MRAAMQQSNAPVIAVTPIIGGRAVKGPAAKMLAELGLEVSGAAVARRYADLLDGFVFDQVDEMSEPPPGVTFSSAATLMTSTADRVRLAGAVLQAADALRH
jgi:LPPG:FO 2-phospho-L-lactate transferase